MTITIFLFAGLSELFGTAQLQLETEKQVTVRRLKEIIIEQYPHAASVVELCFIAKNHAYADSDETIDEGDEIALIPPVSGGEPQTGGGQTQLESVPMFCISRDPLSVEAVTSKVMDPNHGATITFTGTTREYTYGQRTMLLEYEAYVPMALKTMEQIGEEIDSRWPGTLTAITHRIGRVDIGEFSVVIAVSAPHREACYAASRYAIERLKQIVPIWKKEIWEDGSEWKGHQLGPWDPTLKNEMNG